jgi:hypothetical protein
MAIVGDEVPPPYPILDVHVPEPSLGSLEKKLAADGEQKLNLELDEVVQRMATADEAMQASMASLATKIQQSTIGVEATTNVMK